MAFRHRGRRRLLPKIACRGSIARPAHWPAYASALGSLPAPQGLGFPGADSSRGRTCFRCLLTFRSPTSSCRSPGAFVPVGTALSGRPPDRSRRADFPHRAPTDRSTGQRNVERARGGRFGAQAERSVSQTASSSRPSIGHAGFVAAKRDARPARWRGGRSRAPASSWARRNSGRDLESRSSTSGVVPRRGHAVAVGSPRGAPPAWPFSSCGTCVAEAGNHPLGFAHRCE